MFGRRGSDGRIDLHDRADQHDLPVGMRVGHARRAGRRSNRSSITPKKPSRGSRQLAPGPAARRGGLARPGGSARRRRCWESSARCGWRVLLGAVQAGAAGEHHVGALAAAPPRAAAAAGGAPRKARQLVHAVVDRRASGASSRGERQRHRRVQPGDVFLDLLPAQQQVQHLREPRAVARRSPAFSDETRPADAEPRRRELHVPRVGTPGSGRDRLLDEEHEPPAGETRDQMLGALVDGIPSQVRVDHEGELGHATPRRFPGTRLAVSIP